MGEKMIRSWKVAFIALILTIGIFSVGHAVDIQNDGNCDVCPGAIHYGPGETKDILGQDGFRLILALRENTAKVKIDLDGVMRVGTQKDPDSGYEMVIWGYQPMYIKSLIDGSTILIATDAVQTQTVGGFKHWRPELFIFNTKTDAIELKDAMGTAWEKLEQSQIFKWVTSGKGAAAWAPNLPKKLTEVLELFSKNYLVE
jgi:hypothetical protein